MLPVGYFPCTQDPPKGENVARMIDEIVEQAELCEQVGFDGFFFTEHHQQEDGYLPAPVLMAGIVGARTKRIKVGTCVLLAPLYHPIRLAEDIAVVDQATKGRFITAAGIAYQPSDFDAFGVNIKQRVGRTEEVVEVLRKAWTGQPFSHPSKYHKIENVRVTPTPYQKGGTPIWLAGWVPEGIERAGRVAAQQSRAGEFPQVPEIRPAGRRRGELAAVIDQHVREGIRRRPVLQREDRADHVLPVDDLVVDPVQQVQPAEQEGGGRGGIAQIPGDAPALQHGPDAPGRGPGAVLRHRPAGVRRGEGRGVEISEALIGDAAPVHHHELPRRLRLRHIAREDPGAERSQAREQRPAVDLPAPEPAKGQLDAVLPEALQRRLSARRGGPCRSRPG